MDGINWAQYALDYDAMCAANPAYEENLQHLVSRVDGWQLPADAKVLDIGAGTGAFICALSERLPNAQYTHLDFNATMNARALIKYREHSLNVNVIGSTLADAEIPGHSQDLIICVNALYAMADPQLVLRRIRRLLKPGGKFFLIDFGREMNVARWSLYLLRSLVQKHGAIGALGWFWRYRDSLKQNRKGMQAQRRGNYWLHSPSELAFALEDNGWCIEELATCYRGDCDLAICRPY
jgi:ubiquinone/menaquinone biosynthesis C-methylase UbiE